MARTITIEVQPDDVEHVLRGEAFKAAKFSALADYMTAKTHDSPTLHAEAHADARKRWSVEFLRAKRLVEAFGVEYQPTSEAETLTVTYDWVGGKRELTGLGFVRVTGSKPDYKHPRPAYRREVHTHACHAAADRVVRAWRAKLAED